MKQKAGSLSERTPHVVSSLRHPPGESKLRRSIRAFLFKHRTMERDVLDAGSAESPYRELFPNATTLDIAGDPDLKASVTAIPASPESFSLVVATELIEHVRDPLTALKEMHRVLVPYGRLLLTTRSMCAEHCDPDFFRFTRAGLAFLLSSAGFATFVIEEENAFSEVVRRAWRITRNPVLLIVSIVLSHLDGALPVTGLYVVAWKGGE